MAESFEVVVVSFELLHAPMLMTSVANFNFDNALFIIALLFFYYLHFFGVPGYSCIVIITVNTQKSGSGRSVTECGILDNFSTIPDCCKEIDEMIIGAAFIIFFGFVF